MFEQSSILYQEIERGMVEEVKTMVLQNPSLLQSVSQLITNHGIDLINFYNPLEAAALMGNLELVKFFSQYLDPTEHENLTLTLAARHDNVDLMTYLLNDVRVTTINVDPLYRAILYHNNNVALKLLADPRVDPSEHHNHPIRCAVSSNNIAIAKELIKDNRVNPGTDHSSLLANAAEHGYFRMTELLLSSDNVDPSANNNKALKRALDNDNCAIGYLLFLHMSNHNMDPAKGLTHDEVEKFNPLLEKGKIAYQNGDINKEVFFMHKRKQSQLSDSQLSTKQSIEIEDLQLTKKLNLN